FTLSDHALELRVLGFQGTKTFDVGRVERTELLAPDVDRLLADLVLARDLSDRTRIGLAQDLHHLFFGEPALLHGLLATGAEAILSSYRWLEKPGQVTPPDGQKR